MQECIFCQVVQGRLAAFKIFEDSISVAFLDHRPLFPGHCLLVPKNHFEVLSDLPGNLLAPFFANAQLLTRAVEVGMSAEGTFVALNNRVSQSVPHLHLHIVPRRKGDGLKGFFWPRRKYRDEDEALAAQKSIQDAITSLKSQGS